MFLTKFLRFFLLALSFRIVEEGGGGGAPVASPAPPSDASPAAESADAPVAATPAPGPTSMLDAISATLHEKQGTEPAPAPGQPRDPQGRFAPKDANGTPIAAPAPVGATPAAVAKSAVPGAPAVPATPAAPAPGEQPEDLTVMPEGLQPKAQERFQKLANSNKELTGQVETLSRQTDYMRSAFQANGVQQPQFEQAVAVIGMLNKGDFRGALAVLDQQRKVIAMQLGEPLPGVDALSDFPDLRQAVDNMQITETHAMELARNRAQQLAGQQQLAQQQEQQQTQQAQQQAVQAGTNEVDALCKQLASSDLDWPVIEEQLVPVVQKLFRQLPPNQWKNALQSQYDLMKGMASRVRQTNQTPGSVLRPTGQASPASAPKTAYEAMWGTQA